MLKTSKTATMKSCLSLLVVFLCIFREIQGQVPKNPACPWNSVTNTVSAGSTNPPLNVNPIEKTVMIQDIDPGGYILSTVTCNYNNKNTNCGQPIGCTPTIQAAYPTPPTPPFSVMANGDIRINAGPAFNQVTMVPVYTIIINCNGNTTSTLYVFVKPAPYFTNLPNTVYIPENQGGGAIFLTKAVENSMITSTPWVWSIAPGFSGPFSIDQSGQVHLAGSVAYCTQSVYYVPIVITDACQYSRTSTLTVSITQVCDVPTLSNLPARVHVREDTYTRTNFFTCAFGSKACVAPNFYIDQVAPWQSGWIFWIDPLTGQVFYAANPGFSHPKQVIYSITIKLVDMCGEDTEVLTVEIDAVTPPKINQNTASVTIYEEQSVGSVVPYYWYATTEDALCQSQLQWSITCCTPQMNWFSISTVNGLHLVNSQWISYAAILPTTTFTLDIHVVQAAGLYLTDDLMLTITVLHINHPPKFTPNAGTFFVNEQLPTSTSVPSNYFSATDVDVAPGLDTLTYTIVPALYANYFSLGPGNPPYVRTSVVFDTATMPLQYTLQIRATDSYGLFDTYYMTININSVPQKPVFSPSTATITVKENQGGGYTIPYNFVATEHLTNDVITYSLDTTQPYASLVNLNTVSNNLVTTANYKYMTTPPVASFNAYIIAKELVGGLQSTFTLTISIVPVNQAPKFTPNVGVTQIFEGQPVNTPLAINFPAVDPNGDPLTYTLGTAQGSYLFHINTSPLPHLETSSVIVYAALGQTTYNFQITAMDPGGLSDIFYLEVDILQANHPPVFSPSQDVVHMPEEEPAGTDVDYNIIATGMTTLTYSILPTPGYGTDFVLATAPAVHLKNAVVFNYEAMGGVYSLPVYVKATDLTGLSATFTLTVIIDDVDEPPVFMGTTSCQASISENLNAGAVVPCTFNAVDPEGKSVTYTMTPYSPYYIYNPLPTPHIETTMPLYINQMTSSVNTFTITAADPAGNKATYAVTITVTKANLVPVFTPPAGSCQINEKQATGATAPVFFAATDPDNDVPTYSIVPNLPYSNWFTIVLTPSPHLETNTVLDYNSMYPTTTFNLQIKATNPGGLTSLFTETITVLQVNVAPVFNPTTGSVSINEGQAAGTALPYTFAVTDPNINDVVTLSMQYSPYSYLFNLVQTPAPPHLVTTQIITYSQLTQTIIPLTIQGTDLKGLYSTFILTVTINAINHAPTFTPNFDAVSFKEQLPVGYVVPYNIAAKDIDIGATITYTMVPYAPYSNYFNLVTTSQGYAYLSIAQTINYASLVLKSFIITVTATDNTGLTNNFQLGITIIMVNQAPIFNPTSGNATIVEGQPIGTTVACYFPATQVNGVAMSYTVVPNGNNPYIASFNLVLTPQPHLETTVVFTYSQMLVTTFSFQIYATVPSTGLYAVFLLTITVLPNTMRPPVFSPFSQTISMNEMEPAHTSVGSVVFVATDPNPGSTVSYSMVTTTYSNYYNLLLSPVAHLEVALPIDYNTLTVNPIALQVRATDNQNGQSATFTLYINIQPIQKPPVFNISSPSYTTVYEQSTVGTWLPLIFTCTDPNGDAITYSISSSTEPTYFKVVAVPWTHLEVNSWITYDDPTTPANVNLVITALDSTGRSTNLKVTVNILGVNRPLILSSKKYQGIVSGDGPVGTQIIQATYTCLDKNRAANSPVKWALADVTPVGGASYFAINSNGVVTLAQIPPLSQSDQTFVMNLTVQDAFNPALGDWALLTIIVTPGTYHYNPGNLTFSQQFYNFEIRDDALIGDYAGEVLATRSGDPAPFIYQMGASSIATSVDQNSGVLSVAQTFASKYEYVLNVDVVDTWRTPPTSQYTSLRLDTYSAKQYLTDFIINQKVTTLTQATLLSFMSALTVALQTEYPDAYPRLVYVNKARYTLDGRQATTTAPTVTATTNITVVVLKGTSTDSVTSLNQAKQYYSTPDVQAATVDSSGKPTSAITPLTKAGFTVNTVLPFIYSVPTNTTTKAITNWLTQTPNGNVVIGVLCALGLTAGLLLGLGLSFGAFGGSGCFSVEAAKEPTKMIAHYGEGGENDMDFRYRAADAAREFKRYDPKIARNPTPPASSVMKSPRRPPSSLTDVDSDYHSRAGSANSLSSISLHSSLSHYSHHSNRHGVSLSPRK